MDHSPAPDLDAQIVSDTLKQRHDLMIELYRLDQVCLDQAGATAHRQDRGEELRRIEQTVNT